jgi:hypothetical protein
LLSFTLQIRSLAFCPAPASNLDHPVSTSYVAMIIDNASPRPENAVILLIFKTWVNKNSLI